MGNTSATGGVLSPVAPVPIDDDALDSVLQLLVVSITGLIGSLVRPRWQPVIPKQPDAGVNWCAIGVLSSIEQNCPSLDYDPVVQAGVLSSHEELQVLASFYGPGAKGNAQLLRNGLKIPQNCEQLLPYGMRFIDSSAMRNVPDLLNQQWIRRYDLPLRFRRKLSYTVAVETLAVAAIHLIDDTLIVDDTFVVPPGTTVEP